MSSNTSPRPVAVIGAGQAGISVALSLKDRGVTPLLIDRSPEVAATWRQRYDRLRLNTGRQFSRLPHRPYPPGTSLYPTRDEVVSYLDRHAHEDGIELRLGTAVERIDRAASGWRLRTSIGDIHTRVVVVTTGYDDVPHIPQWPGDFGGKLLHSSDYRNPQPYNDARVLVVGCGSSGMEIAHDLATGGAAKVWMSVRTPPNIALRAGPAGLPVDVLTLPLYRMPAKLADRIARAGRLRTFGDLAHVGLPIPEEGPFTRAHRLGISPTVVDAEVIDAIRDGAVEVVADVAALEHDKVALRGGGVVDPDVVICATGYRRGTDALLGHLGAFGADDGLYVHGVLTRPALLGYVGRQSPSLARRIVKQL